MMLNKVTPVTFSERHIILDVLRGIALLGICLANFPEFSLYTFQTKEVVEVMPTAAADNIWRYFHYIFIDGKFYSLFSLLFGIGFSIIISNMAQKNQGGFAFFYRRMFILAIIGFLHLLLMWAGDILLLYALVGFLLPLFRNVSNRKLLIISASLIFFPIVMDTFKILTDYRFSLIGPVEKAIHYYNVQNGITGDNFGVWLLEGKSYSDVLKFNLSGAFIRCQEFIEGNRAFKVLGLFVLGLYIGRNRFYARLDDHISVLKKIRFYGFLWGLPFSCLFAWNEVNQHPYGLIAGSTIYALSVVPMSFAYISAICLWFVKHRNMKIFKILAAPGRMALTNYIGQSAMGMIIFYGIGFQLALMGLVYVELIAAGVFALQILCSNVWLHYFRFGPLEWIWRMLTYGKWLKIINTVISMKMNLLIGILFPIVLLSCRQQNSGQQNWQWRGENRDGIYHETGLLKEWPDGGPQMLWHFSGLGEGHTSAAISGEKLYITGLSDERLMLYVLDLTGKLLVKKEISDEWMRGQDGPRSTVCINEGKLYIYNALGKLFCFDEATLSEVWTKDLFSDFDGKNIPWGVTESPLIVGDKIIMTPGGVTNNMVALNKNTGELIWSSPGEGTVSAYCSPQYIDDQSVPMVVTSTFDYIIALNVDTGEKLWSFPRTSEYNNHPNTPLYYNDMIFSNTGDGAPAVMLCLKNGGKEVEMAWENSELDTQMGGAVRIDNYVYTTGHRNRFWFCVDWNTGETKYKVRNIAPCSVISADGMLYCYSEKGTMNLVKPNPDRFELVSSFEITLGTGTHWAHPVICQGVMYIRHGDTLMAYKVR